MEIKPLSMPFPLSKTRLGRIVPRIDPQVQFSYYLLPIPYSLYHVPVILYSFRENLF